MLKKAINCKLNVMLSLKYIRYGKYQITLPKDEIHKKFKFTEPYEVNFKAKSVDQRMCSKPILSVYLTVISDIDS